MKVKVRKKNIERVEKSEQVTETKKKTLVKWLEENKIIFETLLAVTLSVASLIVSVMSVWQEWVKADNESKLYMPIFSVQKEYVRKEADIDGLHYPEDYLIEYKLVNQGGELASGKAELFQMLQVEGLTTDFSGDFVIKYKFFEAFLDSTSYYEPDTKTFTAYQHLNNDSYRVINTVQQRLDEAFPDYTFILSLDDYAKVSYTDYKGIENEGYYDLMARCQVDKPDKSSIWAGGYEYIHNFHSLSVDELYSVIVADIEAELKEIQ